MLFRFMFYDAFCANDSRKDDTRCEVVTQNTDVLKDTRRLIKLS